MKKINNSRELEKIIKITDNYENDLKKANKKGYTFSSALHSIININRNLKF